MDETRVPNNQMAEKEFLASCMHVGRVLVDPPSPADFFNVWHRTIANAIVGLSETGAAINDVAVYDELRRRGREEEADYVLSVLLHIPAIMTAESQRMTADMIRRTAKHRRMLQQALSLVESIRGENDNDIAAHVESIDQISREGNAAGQDAYTAQELESAFHRYAVELDGERIQTGIHGFDEKAGGIGPGQVLTIIARPGVGKTAIVQNIKRHVLRQFASVAAQKSAAMVSAELPKEEVFLRQMQIHAEMSEHDVIRAYRSGELDMVARDEFMQAAEKRWLVIPRPKLTMRTVQRIIAGNERLKRIYPCKLVILDYLGLFDSGLGTRASEVQSYGSIAKDAKVMAKEMNAAVILLSQMSRAGGGGGWEPVTMTGARGSGEIEEAADFMLGVWRPELNPELRENNPAEWQSVRGVMCWRILKGRRCPLGDFETRFSGQTLRVTED